MKPFLQDLERILIQEPWLLTAGAFYEGAGWCTIDALMRFDCDSYYRILSRAKQAGRQFPKSLGWRTCGN